MGSPLISGRVIKYIGISIPPKAGKSQVFCWQSTYWSIGAMEDWRDGFRGIKK
jgi:hypothetical protein